MTDRELLEQLLSGMNEIRSDVAELKKDVAELKQDVAELKQDVAGLKQDVAGLKQDVAGLKQDVAGLKQKTDDLEMAQKRTETTLEHTVDKCVQVLYEAHQMNAERLDRYNIDNIRSNAEIAVLVAKIAHEEVKSLRSA